MTPRKVSFAELMPTPKEERDRSVVRRKTFQTYFLSSPENQKIIAEADKATKKKDEVKAKRELIMKEAVAKNKKEEAAKKKAERNSKKKAVGPVKRGRGRPRGGPKL